MTPLNVPISGAFFVIRCRSGLPSLNSQRVIVHVLLASLFRNERGRWGVVGFIRSFFHQVKAQRLTF